MKLHLLLILIFFTSISQAKSLFEVNLGYVTGSQLQYKIGSNQYAYDSANAVAGLSFTWVSGMGLSLGLKAESHLSGKLSPTALTQEETFSKTAAGVELGYFNLRGLKFFVGYDFMYKDTITVVNVQSPSELSGTATYAGMTYYFGPRFGMGVVYTIPSYTETKGANTYTDIADKSLAVMLNFPLFNGSGGGKRR